ncbi:hypothetical protein GBA65_08745 [Rubrobacter marinus]|uniref:Roadblock/LAMTOR2 domain-containing protein n=1 Tax=Rubrobacter marinus TaxID=2653852 RepID=A0A6G8PWK4_9ACTN|nr:hypothetical protein [Rubrobacter marinus]QIN78594.1 hypothetical protein GBA65_08745 [Rubrobacter marinus]
MIETNLDVHQAMQELMGIHGAVGASIVDYESGMVLADAGSHVDLEYTAARFSDVVRMNLDIMKVSGLDDGMEDILITYDNSFVLLRILRNAEGLFMQLNFNKIGPNIGLARYKLGQVDRRLTI